MNFHIIKTSFRRLKYHKQFTIINIVGLAVGFTFLSVIVLFLVRELSYDRFHVKSGSIYIMEMQLKEDEGVVQKSKHVTIDQIDALKSEIPGITNITFLNYTYFDQDNGTWLKYDNNKYQLHQMAFSSPSFADIFSFRVVAGNLSDALEDPMSLVLTEDNAFKIFGNENPVGKNVLLNNKPVTVKAVVEANPSNSSIRFDGIINYKAAKYFTGHNIEDCSNLAFLEISPNADLKSLENTCLKTFLRDVSADRKSELDNRVNLKLIPLKNSYFNEGDAFDPMRHGNKTLNRIILALGILILILAVINYINLFYASSFKRYKEIAVRGISGAKPKLLITQFMADAITISLISLVVSLILTGVTLPWFNNMIDYPLEIKQLFKSYFIAFFIVIAIIVGLIAGLFSALSATRTPLVYLFKSKVKTASRHKVWRHLVIFQMAVSILLIACTIAIAKQMSFARNIDMGFRSNNVVTLPVSKLGDKKAVFMQLIENHLQTEAQAISSTYLNTYNSWGGYLNNNGHEQEISFHVIHANADFFKTLDIKFDKGRSFFKDNNLDLNSCIINLEAAKKYGLAEPLSAKINGNQIVGVVKDFHIQSLYNKIGPVVIFNAPISKIGLASIRFRANNMTQVADYMSFLRTNWEKLSPEDPFEFEFLDQRLRNMYLKDEKLMNAFSSFAVLALLIACLGLFGLISFISENRTKEIGIRKINGARTAEVMAMLNGDFIKWVAIAFVIACPIAWYAMHQWLQNFAYKTELSWWVFAFAGVLALAVALLTVSWQSWRAATRNPVESLRYE